MFRKIAVTAALAFLASAATAQATLRPADDVVDPRVLAVARAQWPDSPCAGRERVSVQLRVYHGMQDFAGWAYYDTVGCPVEVRQDWMADAYSACVILTHEFGHLSGIHQESDVPGDIMNGPGLSELRDYAPCLELVR